MGGAASLFTVEHFQAAKNCLNKGGIMSQWVPMYELSRSDFRTIIASFVHVFPESALFFTGHDVVILGWKDRLLLDQNVLHERIAIPTVRRSLASLGIYGMESILGMYVGEFSCSKIFQDHISLNCDRFPVIEFSAPKNALSFTPESNQQVLIEIYNNFPEAFLKGIGQENAALVLRNHAALKLMLESGVLKSKGYYDQSVEKLFNACRLQSGNSVIIYEAYSILESSAKNYQTSGAWSKAMFQYQDALICNPNGFWALHNMVVLSMLTGQTNAAYGFLERGLQAYPNSPFFRALRGKYKLSKGDTMGAIDDVKWACDNHPESRELLDAYNDITHYINCRGRSGTIP